ncbi:MAG TPA: hypothetical protein VIN07_03810 [Flavipsychrobacter sp.]
MDRKKEIAALVGLIFGAAAVYFFMYYLPSSNSSVEESLSAAAETMNKSMPMQVDQETRLDSVGTLPGKVMVYYNTLVNVSIAYGEGDLDTNLVKEQLEPIMQDAIASDDNLKAMRDTECTFLYKYRDAEGAYLFSIAISPEKYNREL